MRTQCEERNIAKALLEKLQWLLMDEQKIKRTSSEFLHISVQDGMWLRPSTVGTT